MLIQIYQGDLVLKLKGYLIVSIIFLAILTLGAVNAADNMTTDDLATVGDSEDFDLSSPYEEIIDDGEILNLSGDISIDNILICISCFRIN